MRPREQNVVSLKLRIDESSNPCGLKLKMVTIYYSNDEITPNTDWEFQSKNGELDCFRTTCISLNGNKKIVQVFLSLITFVASII